MSEPFIGEIRIVAFNFPPKGWVFCNGQLLPILQNQALFSLLGTTYDGNGQSTFGLPNLLGRVPIHVGPGFVLGQRGGEIDHTLTMAQMPAHSHNVGATVAGANTADPAGAIFGAAQTYELEAVPIPLNNALIGITGGGQRHENEQPYLVLTFIIALQGIFPTRN